MLLLTRFPLSLMLLTLTHLFCVISVGFSNLIKCPGCISCKLGFAMFTSAVVPFCVNVSVKYPVVFCAVLGRVCHIIPYNDKLNLFGSLSNHASLNVLYIKSLSSNFFKYVGNLFVICSFAVLLLSIIKFSDKFVSSINNAPSSANTFVV